MDLEGIIIIEVSQTEKDKYCLILYMESKKDNKVVVITGERGRGRGSTEVVRKGVSMGLYETM